MRSRLCFCGEGRDLRPDHDGAVVVGELADDGDSGRLASRQRSTAASVWPERISTPPSLAISGKTWPGRTKSLAPMLSLASARTVLQRCSAEMPVVMPCFTSTETVKAVPSGASFAATIGGRLSLRASFAGQRRAHDAAAVADDERHLLGRAERGGDDHVALVLAVVVVGDDDDLAARERLDGFRDGMIHGGSLSPCRRIEKKVVGRHGAPGLGDDALGGLPRKPGPVVATDQGHGAGGDPDAAGEFRASDGVALEPIGELHRGVT